MARNVHWLRSYRRSWLRGDLLAGLTTAAVVIPQAMAYASIAGLGVEFGLYVALVPMLVYALLGTSGPLSVSCTSTIALLTAHQLARIAHTGPGETAAAAATLALLTGAFLVLAGIARLGFIASFISDPVLIGFKGGIGLVIVASQVPTLLGVDVEHLGFFDEIVMLAGRLGDTHLPTLALACAMFALLFGVRRLAPSAPAPLIAIATGIGVAALFGLKESGIALTGRIPPGIPMPRLPDLSLVHSLWPGALGIALMSFAESIAAGRAFARVDDPRPAPNREMAALGAANIAGSFFHSFPAGGGTTQTAVNAGAGARTQLAALVTVSVVAATLLFLAPLIGFLPQVTLAAVVTVTTLPLLGPSGFRAILAIRRTEFYWALAACLGVILLGTLEGILVAVALSIMTLLHQANNPLVYALGRKPGTEVFRPLTGQHPQDETLPGLLIVRTEGLMTFASVPAVAERMEEMVREASPRVVIFDCSAIPDFEYTALQRMIESERRLAKAGIALWLCSLNPSALEVVERSALGARLGHAQMFFNLQAAVAAFEAQAAANG